jgi:signal transduction histidine kinase
LLQFVLMDEIKHKEPIVFDGVNSALLPRISLLESSYFLLAIIFASVLSSVYYYTSSSKFNTRTSESKETILEVVSAFESTYSKQRKADKIIHLPDPTTFMIQTLKRLDTHRFSANGEGMHIDLVGVQGRSVKKETLDPQVLGIIRDMRKIPNPKSWNGYIGGIGEEVLRTIKPMLASKQSCVDCHNSLKKDNTIWKFGEVIGAYVIDAPASRFLKQLRWETGFLWLSTFLFIWSSVAFFIRQQAHLSTTKAEVLQESERGKMLTAAREQAESEASKLSAQVRKAYEDLRQALEKERKLNKLQRQFISMASHEFRTPLAIIDGAAQRLERRSSKSDREEINKRAHKIRGAVERMTKVMESTLSAASLDVGKLTIHVKPCDIVTLLNEACQRQGELSENHYISCDFSELPVTIQADPNSLEQIFSNLLSNAVKYSPGSPEIEVKAYAEASDVVFSIRDCGIGIDAEDLPRMFERFFRARTATGIAGTGIGLNLIKVLIELHDGSITLESKVGKGSTFTVRLPISGPEEIDSKDCQAA